MATILYLLTNRYVFLESEIELILFRGREQVSISNNYSTCSLCRVCNNLLDH